MKFMSENVHCFKSSNSSAMTGAEIHSRDCVSRHNGGTSGAPLTPLRVDRALSVVRIVLLLPFHLPLFSPLWAQEIGAITTTNN